MLFDLCKTAWQATSYGMVQPKSMIFGNKMLFSRCM